MSGEERRVQEWLVMISTGFKDKGKKGKKEGKRDGRRQKQSSEPRDHRSIPSAILDFHVAQKGPEAVYVYVHVRVHVYIYFFI